MNVEDKMLCKALCIGLTLSIAFIILINII